MLPKVLAELESSPDIVAVINPGRAGVGMINIFLINIFVINHSINKLFFFSDRKVIKVLRECPQVKRVVYISCKADHPATIKNFVDLCKADISLSPVFFLTDIQPIDMFPHTSHSELILAFQR
jgi:hypothetical protein